MARNDQKTEDTKVADPKAAADVPIIDTAKLLGAEPDPRGDNRPGVLPDAPQEGIDPVTNLRQDLVDPVSGLPKGATQASAEPLNPPSGSEAPPDAAPKGRKIKMVATADIWPRTRPKGWDADQEYRIRAGEEVELPEEEAMDRMEAGTARRADRRA